MTLMFQFLLFSSLISLGQSNWEELEFDGIPANQTSFSNTGISIEVDNSASPLIHVFPSTKTVRKVVVTGSVDYDHNQPTGTDDALLRVGVIQAGEKRLNAFQKLTAPDWLQRVDELVGATGKGVASILCFHLTPDPSKVGQTQTNPNASIFEETNQAAPDRDGNFKIVAEFSDPISSPGLWLMADGDNSGSSFQVCIEHIEVTE